MRLIGRPSTEVWVEGLRDVYTQGIRSKPRGMETRELLGYRSWPVDMSYPVLDCPERKLGYRFLAAEAAWILTGDDRVSSIGPYSKEIAKFSDDGVVFAGAYGPKVVDQLDYVVGSLVRDLDTRQAVLNIWRESPGPSKDVPCTLSVQFLVREGCLHCVDTMRSSDLWLGHPYDIFNFSMLAAYVAVELRTRTGAALDLGNLYMSAGSKHIYERNFSDVETVLCRDVDFMRSGPRVDLNKFDTAPDLVDFLWGLADSGKALEQSSWDA